MVSIFIFIIVCTFYAYYARFVPLRLFHYVNFLEKIKVNIELLCVAIGVDF